MKKLLLLGTVTGILTLTNSCREEKLEAQNEVVAKNGKDMTSTARNSPSEYVLDEGTTTKFTSFSHMYGVFEMTISKGSDPDSYEILSLKKDKNHNPTIVQENFSLLVTDSNLRLSTFFEGDIYAIEKDFDTKELFVVKNEIRRLIDSNVIDDLNSNATIEANKQNRLIALLVELYDDNLPHTDASEMEEAPGKGCAEFVHSAGLTSSASGVRANTKAQAFLAESDNAGCSKVGSDTSCLLDAHVCVTTVTFNCPC